MFPCAEQLNRIMEVSLVPLFSRLHATVAACKLFTQSTIRVLMDSSYSAKMIPTAILPFFAIDFTRDVVRLVNNYTLSRFLNRLRGPLLDRAHYRALVDHIKIPMVEESLVFAPVLEEWRLIIVRNNLTDQLALPDWIPIINLLAASLIVTPRDLATWLPHDIAMLADSSPHPQAILGLFRATLVVCDPPPSATSQSSWQLLASAHSLASDLRVSDISETTCARPLAAAQESLDLPPEFPHLGPAAKIRRLMESTSDRTRILRYLNAGAQVNTLRQVQDSLKSVASGIQRYASFCDLIQVDYFPPAPETILRWSTLFAPGRTFGHYLAHVSKACQLMNVSTSWITPAIRGVANGLANAQDVSFRFDNFVQKELLTRLIRFETLSTEIGRLFYLSYLFLLRVPSEGIPIRRAALTDIILTKSPQSTMALMGIRFIDKLPRLILKLKKRKLNKTGVKMTRPCFRDGEGLVPQGLCPIHDFWPLVQRSIMPGNELFPTLRGKNINRILKSDFESNGN